MPKILCEENVDVYEGFQLEIVNTTRFDENSDLSTTYLGKSDKTRNDKLKVEESFPISEYGYTLGQLLDGTECQLLLDTGASKSFISKSFYMWCKSLHSLPKFASKTQRKQVGNGQCVSVYYTSYHRHAWTQVWNSHISIRDSRECRLGLRYKECVQIGRNNKFKRLLFQIFE